MLESTYKKHKHLIGMQINKWTVLDIVEHRNKDKGYVYAKCQCVCGAIRDVRLSKLLDNSCQDCGCGHEERQKEKIKEKYKHLIGATINGWTILDIIPPDENRLNTHLLCQCQCGTIKEVKLSYVTKERSKDCGCGRKKTVGELFSKDLTGQKFGKLLVVENIDGKRRLGKKLYRCLCDCGNEIILQTNQLTTHHTSSCGCLLSYYNMYINQFLTDSKIDFKSEYTIWVGDNYYRFDFYLPQYNLFIEYDGEQHYKPVRYSNQSDEEMENSFKRTQEHDRIKNLYCEENSINLLRIPYWEKENIETIINSCLQRLSEKGFVEQTTEYATV